MKDFTLVILESPYAGNVEENIEYAKEAMRDCLMRQESPFASHMLFTQVLNDDIPNERDWGIFAGLAWGKVASKTVVYTDLGISEGMRYGIERAKGEGRPVEYREIRKK